MRRRPRSVRLRLTIWYAMALAAIVLCFAIGVYFFVRSSLLREIDTQLDKDFATVARVVREEPFEINELAQHGSVDLFQVRERNEVIAETGAWSRAGLEKALAGRSPAKAWSWESPNEMHYRIKDLPATVPGHSYIIAVAEDEQTLRTSLYSLGLILALGVPVALAVAMVGGYFLAGRVLEPVGAMAVKAGEITADRLSERLPIENPDDEFGRLAAAFNETFQRLQDAFERLRRFTADASHELRTPLTAIRSVGEVGLQREMDANSSREVIASMLEEADRLTKLVDSLLILSRADAGTIMINRLPVDIAALTSDVIDCIAVLAEEKEQVVSIEVRDPVYVEVDPATIRQAVMNLIDNAVKYTPQQGQITVRVREVEGNWAAVEVVDEGPGIPKEHQRKIFDRFYRIDKGRSRDIEGSGLGLAITKWAVEANGGRIELESEEGHGSTFKILLPSHSRD
jgi:heavy metal sensor kinase